VNIFSLASLFRVATFDQTFGATMNKWKVLLAAGALSLAATLPAAAATLQVEGDILTGAAGVTVNTAAGLKTYNVEFLDGSCVTLFSNCAPPGSSLPAFAFTNEDDARVASQALFDQVFLGIFDTQPEKTRGCSFERICRALTPYSLVGNLQLMIGADNFNDTNLLLGPFEGTRFFNPADQNFNTYARWTEVAVVPVPAGATLVLSGLVAFAGLRWRKGRGRRRVQV
jgi:hypothetical protein